MSDSVPRYGNPENLLLAALSPDEQHSLLNRSETVDLNFGTVIYGTGDEIHYVYFLLGGIVSLLSKSDTLTTLEVGIVGKEGFAGLPAFLGADRSVNEAIVQGQGTALRVETRAFQEECQQSDDLSRILKRYTNYRLTQVSVTAGCNRFHKVDTRLARWLLMTQDRMESNLFRITHEFLSHMLGVRREAVTLAAHTLQEKGVIRYSRGNMHILDRTSLLRISCDCYRLICEEEKRIFY